MTNDTQNMQDQQLQTTEQFNNNGVSNAEPIESSAQGRRPERTITPRASVYETAEEVVLELEMPGVGRDAIDINVENDELSISGKRMVPADSGFEMLHQERLPLNYRRSFVLSDRIDSGNIKAKCADGVLQLTLPKAATAKPRRISIE